MTREKEEEGYLPVAASPFFPGPEQLSSFSGVGWQETMDGDQPLLLFTLLPRCCVPIAIP